MEKILNYLKVNLYQIVNLVEAVIRLAGAIVIFTKTSKDDEVVQKIKEVFKKIKDYLRIE